MIIIHILKIYVRLEPGVTAETRDVIKIVSRIAVIGVFAQNIYISGYFQRAVQTGDHVLTLDSKRIGFYLCGIGIHFESRARTRKGEGEEQQAGDAVAQQRLPESGMGAKSIKPEHAECKEEDRYAYIVGQVLTADHAGDETVCPAGNTYPVSDIPHYGDVLPEAGNQVHCKKSCQSAYCGDDRV